MTNNSWYYNPNSLKSRFVEFVGRYFIAALIISATLAIYAGTKVSSKYRREVSQYVIDCVGVHFVYEYFVTKGNKLNLFTVLKKSFHLIKEWW